MEAANDNDPNDLLPFITLCAAARNVMTYLENEKRRNRDGANHHEPEKKKKEDAEQSRDYIEQRVKEIAQFERRAAGNKNRSSS